MWEKCIIAISHSDYLRMDAGTEKCMREIASLLKKKDIHYFQIFSFEENSRLYRLTDMSGKVGVNFDKKFLGIYDYKSLCTLLKKISEKKKIQYTGIHIHNIKNHDFVSLDHFFRFLELPVIVWLHDYSVVCPDSPILLTGEGECCNNFLRDDGICRCCKYGYTHKKRSEEVKRLFRSIDTFISDIIAPSNCVKQNIEIAYPSWKSRITVRGHLEFSEPVKYSGVHDPIRIAYAGGKYVHKGITEWNRILEHFRENTNYEFYYLGSDTDSPNAKEKNVYVDVSVQGDGAMIKAAKKVSIDVAFLWSTCQETYSYTYYELRTAGAKVITNKNSGNIAEAVRNDNSGIVFDRLGELIELMQNYRLFRKKITECTPEYYSRCRTNRNVDPIIPDGSCILERGSGKCARHPVLNFVYKCRNLYKRMYKKTRRYK